MSSLGTRHPSEEQLLRYSDGELGAPEAENIRKHLEACWECRSELEAIERTIAQCVQYRKTVLDASLPPPPAPWFDIYGHLREIDAQANRRRFAARALAALRGLPQRPRQWAPAAAVLALVAVLVYEFRLTPSVQAAELLHKAVAAAQSQPRAPRRIQIRTRTKRLTRVVGAGRTLAQDATEPWRSSGGEDPAALLESLFRAANYDWDDPLSAKSYAEWRDQLPNKRDEVTAISDSRDPEQNGYHLRTTTTSGELMEATLRLQGRDLRAVEETFQFRNREWVEITELPGPPALAPSGPAEAIAAPRAAPLRKAERRLETPSPVATPGEELQVLAALHRVGADLGDPVEVTRSGGQILVSGVGIALERQQRIRDEMRAIPRVTVRFSDPSAETHEPESRDSRGISVEAGVGRVQLNLEKQLGGRAAFEQFADQVLGTTDAFLSRAHALRRLAERFPPAVEEQMSAEERQLLTSLRREHAEALRRSVIDTQNRVEPAAVAIGAPRARGDAVTAGSDSWQDATEEMFGCARRTEALLIEMLGGAAGENQPADLPAQVVASVSQLRARVEGYLRFTAVR